MSVLQRPLWLSTVPEDPHAQVLIYRKHVYVRSDADLVKANSLVSMHLVFYSVSSLCTLTIKLCSASSSHLALLLRTEARGQRSQSQSLTSLVSQELDRFSLGINEQHTVYGKSAIFHSGKYLHDICEL